MAGKDGVLAGNQKYIHMEYNFRDYVFIIISVRDNEAENWALSAQ